MLVRATTVAVVVFAVACAGCGKDPAKQADDELKLASSWAATARMVAEAWRRGAVTRPYALDALEAARTALHDESDRLAREPDVLAAAPVDLLARFRTLEDAVAGARGAVELRDPAALDAALGRL